MEKWATLIYYFNLLIDIIDSLRNIFVGNGNSLPKRQFTYEKIIFDCIYKHYIMSHNWKATHVKN